MSVQGTFSGLGDDWWRQIYDGEYHQYGPMVFDEGLHGKEKEPGFYQSAYNAFNFAKEHCGEPLTVDFYCKLHQIACAHFKGEETNTAITSEKTGKLNACGVSARFPDKKIMNLLVGEISDRTLEDFLTAKKYKGYEDSDLETLEYLKNEKKISVDFDIKEYEKLESLYQENLKLLINDIKNCRHEFLKDCMPHVIEERASISLSYTYAPYRQEKIGKLFAIFNQEVSDLQKITDIEAIREQKIKLVAELYQLLEWIHPFQDGQGRTDLIELSKIASEVGLTPSILEDPYASSIVPLATWTKYLEKGMQKWQVLKASRQA